MAIKRETTKYLVVYQDDPDCFNGPVVALMTFDDIKKKFTGFYDCVAVIEGKIVKGFGNKDISMLKG